MIRVAFTLNSSRDWTGTGGYNYLVNLARVLSEHARERVQPVLFVGKDVDPANLVPFSAIAGMEVIRVPECDDSHKARRLLEAAFAGSDSAAARVFREHKIDAVFESAQFFGWRFPLPVVTWITDFQHRRLRSLFGFAGYWKRELGYRMQVLVGRHIMLSSEDSRRHCELYYPRSAGRTSVVRFAVLPPDDSDYGVAREIADGYRLPERFFYLPNQFWKHKNHLIIIDALHLLKQKGISVVVAASGKQEDYRHPEHFKMIQSLVESRNLSGEFRILGMIPRAHVFALMRSCTALVNPSLSEGWSSTVEESKSLGVPLLLSDLAVHREQAEGMAEFFPPDNAEKIAELLESHLDSPPEDHRKREKQALEGARARVKQFALDFCGTVEPAVASFHRPHGR